MILLALLWLSAEAGASEYQDLPAELPCRYGVIGLRAEEFFPDTVLVAKVILHGPAHRAGLRQGDRIVAIPPYRIRTPAELSRCVWSFAPGEELSLVVRRGPAQLELRCPVTDVRGLYYLMDEQGAQARTMPRHRDWEVRPAPEEQIALELIRTLDSQADLEALQGALALDAGRYGSDGRLQDLHFALHHPLKAAQLAASLDTSFAASASLAAHVQAAARRLDLADAPEGAAQPGPDSSLLSVPHPPALLDVLLPPFTLASQQADRAFASLDQEEQQALFSGIPALLERFGKTLLLDEGDSTETTGHLHTLRLAKRVDLASLFAAAHTLADLARPEVLKEVHGLAGQVRAPLPDSLPSTLGGRFLYARHTAAGWILVGDQGPNFYGEDAVLIVDLGGDDLYFNNGGAPPFTVALDQRRRQWPVGLVIDYQGNDRYLGGGPGTLGAAIGGVGLLIDLEGNDLYQGFDLVQGAAFCGIGLLWDRAGNDQYLARQAVQGTAFFGAGLLIDEQGDDLFLAARNAQGFGGSNGLGLLRDLSGRDRYLADRQVPSSYATPAAYEGWAQGVGCGFIGHGPGGLGLLIDEEGDDQYQAGNFSQGAGYFFGMGVLVDKKGDDAYQGSRYAQGAAAHQAVGVLSDGEGNDVYRAKEAASQGAAWDAAVGILLDRAGDDRYEGEHLSQGAGAMNGLGLLLDGEGNDIYRAASGQGQGSSTEYWGGRNAPNLGLLIDLGKGRDTYTLPHRQDQALFRAAGVGLFADR